MKCQHCNVNEANTHIKRVINGQKEEMYLCSECANELGVMDDFSFEPFSFDGLFSNLLGAGTRAFNSLVGIDSCPSCGCTVSDIINSGRVGCADCYDKFEDKLMPSIEKIHGRTKHIGKNVTYTSAINSSEDEVPKNSVETLKEELKKAVQEQRFEDAAVLRDRIKGMNKES